MLEEILTSNGASDSVNRIVVAEYKEASLPANKIDR